MATDQFIQSDRDMLPSAEELERQARAMLTEAGNIINDPAMTDPDPDVLLPRVRALAHFVLAGRELLEIRLLGIAAQSDQQVVTDVAPELSDLVPDVPTENGHDQNVTRVIADEISQPDPPIVEENESDEGDEIDYEALTTFELSVDGTESTLIIGIDVDGQYFTVGEHKFETKSSDRKQALQLLKVLEAHPNEWLTRQEILDRGFYGDRDIGSDSKRTMIGVARTQLMVLLRGSGDPQLAQLLEERLMHNSKSLQYRLGGGSDQEDMTLNEAERTLDVADTDESKTNLDDSHAPTEVEYTGVLQMAGKDVHLNGQALRLTKNELELLQALLVFRGVGATRHDLNGHLAFLNGRNQHAQDVAFSTVMRSLKYRLNSVAPEVFTHDGPSKTRRYRLNIGEVRLLQDDIVDDEPNNLGGSAQANSSQTEPAAIMSEKADSRASVKAIEPESAVASVESSRPNQDVDQTSLPREARLVMSQFRTSRREMTLTEITQGVHNREEVSAAQSVEVHYTVVGLVAGGHLEKRPNGSYVVPSSPVVSPPSVVIPVKAEVARPTPPVRFARPPIDRSRIPTHAPVVEAVDLPTIDATADSHKSPPVATVAKSDPVSSVPVALDRSADTAVEPKRPKAVLHANGLVVDGDIEPFNRGEIRVVRTLGNFPQGELIHETDFVDALFDRVTRDSRGAFAQNVMPLLARLEAAGLVKIHRRGGGKTFELLADIHEEI